MVASARKVGQVALGVAVALAGALGLSAFIKNVTPISSAKGATLAENSSNVGNCSLPYEGGWESASQEGGETFVVGCGGLF